MSHQTTPLRLLACEHSSDGGGAYFGPRARSMSLRSHSNPMASIFAHCAAVSLIERCSSLSSGGFGGRPPRFFGGSMAPSIRDAQTACAQTVYESQ
jgi:hypothetical protein